MVYGCNRVVDRKTLWDKLRLLNGSIGAEAWILGGDFNFVRNVKEKSDMDSFEMSATAEFNACVRDMEIDDLTAKGFFFQREMYAKWLFSCLLILKILY